MQQCFTACNGVGSAQSCPGSTMTHAARSKQVASADEATCSRAGSRLCSLLSKHMGMWHATITTNSWATPMHPLVNKCMVHTLHLIACCLTATWLPLMLQLANTSSQPNLKILRQTCHVCPTSQIMHCTYPRTLRSAGQQVGWLAGTPPVASAQCGLCCFPWLKPTDHHPSQCHSCAHPVL